MRRYRDQVLREITLAGRTFQLLESLGGGGRERYRTFDRLAGLDVARIDLLDLDTNDGFRRVDERHHRR